MKRFTLIATVIAVLSMVAYGFAYDKATISKNVDTLVTVIENGNDVKGLDANTFEPYAFIMQEDGTMLVHPTLTGKSLKEEAPPVYEALMHATADGVWVEYEWQGKMKHTYAKKTTTNLIVGSGY